MPNIKDEDISRIAKNHKIKYDGALRVAVEKAAREYKILKSYPLLRITREQVKGVEKFEKAAKKLRDTWDGIPEESRSSICAMAHVIGSKFEPAVINYPPECGPPFGYLDVAPSEQSIRRAISDLLELAPVGEDGIKAGRKQPNFAARSIIQNLRDYWESTLERKSTFTHDGSRFENFIRDVTCLINKEEVDKISGVLRETLINQNLR